MKKLLQTMSLAALYALGIHAEDAAVDLDSVMMNDDAVQVSMDDSSSSDFAALLSSAMPDAPENMDDVLSDEESDDAAPAVVQAPQSLALKNALDARESVQSQIEQLTLQLLQENNASSSMLEQLMAARAALQQAFEDALITALTANEIAIASEALDDETRAMMKQFVALLAQRKTIQQQVEAIVLTVLAPQDDNLPEADAPDFADSEDSPDAEEDEAEEEEEDAVIAQSYSLLEQH